MLGPDQNDGRSAPDGDPSLRYKTPDYPSLLADGVTTGEEPLDDVIKQSIGKEFSYAGGLPLEATFVDIDPLKEEAERRWGKIIYQYGPAAGFGPLRERAVPFLQWLGFNADDPGRVIVTAGSQSALSAVGRALFNRGDGVAVERFTYLGAKSAFDEDQVRYGIVPTDRDGMIAEALDEVLSRGDIRYKAIYLCPNFQNPTGVTIPRGRRIDLLNVADKYGIPIIEDDPYGQLRYEGEPEPTFHSLNEEGVIGMTTLSKLLAPGLRIAFTYCPRIIDKALTKIISRRTLCGNIFDQAVAAIYLEGGRIQRHVLEIRELYRPLWKLMDEKMREHFPPNWHWKRSAGGMFYWPEGPGNTFELYQTALQHNVAFVPGRYFSPNGEDGDNQMRICFTHSSPEQIENGIPILGALLKEMQQEGASNAPVQVYQFH